MTTEQALQLLQGWRDAGSLRALDLALARYVAEQHPGTAPSLLVACALLALLEGRGHACLPLDTLLADPEAVLEWPPAQAAEAAAALEPWLQHGEQAWAGDPSNAAVQLEPSDERGRSPLVLSQRCLYLRRYWRCERRVAAQVRARSQLAPALQSAAAGPPDLRALLDQLFDSTAGDTTGPDWQKVACAIALRGRLTVITGGPGTGKTHTAARLLVALQAAHRLAGQQDPAQPLRIALAAPTGKAASRLRQSIAAALQQLAPALAPLWPLAEWEARLGPARTLHALLGAQPGTRRFVHHAAHPLDVDVLFVDEASMVHLEMMDALLDALPPTARLVLLGDKDQLASVEAGAVLADLCRPPDSHAGPVWRADTAAWVQALSGEMLTVQPVAAAAGQARLDDLTQQTVTLLRSRRFAGAIGQLAQAVQRGDARAALGLLPQAGSGAVRFIASADPQPVARLAAGGDTAVAGYSAYLQMLARRPDAAADTAAFEDWARAVLKAFDGFRVLCALREGPWGVSGLNAQIEKALAARGLLQRRGEWYEGRPVMVTRNDAALGVFNGDIGLVLRPPGGGLLRAYFFDGEALRSVSVARLADVQTAFALTVHKSQGSEFGHVLLVLPPDDGALLTRELAYTGITRARERLTVIADGPGRLATACTRATRRWSGLAARLRS